MTIHNVNDQPHSFGAEAMRWPTRNKECCTPKQARAGKIIRSLLDDSRDLVILETHVAPESGHSLQPTGTLITWH